MSVARIDPKKPRKKKRVASPVRAVPRPDPGRVLRPELFFPSLQATSREEVLATFVDALARMGVAQHRDALLDALLEREQLGTTALGYGVAVPHARSMVVAETVVGFARLPSGIEFGAPDGQPVSVVFLIVGPYGVSGAAYLPVLAAIAGAVHDEASRARLLELETFDELERLIRFPSKVKEATAR